jgi:hypothetical protein
MSEIASYWVERGWRVTLATWSDPEIEGFYTLSPVVSGMLLHVHSPSSSIFAKARSNIARVFRLRRLLRASQPHAVLSFIHKANVLTIMTACALPMSIVVSERGSPGQSEEDGTYPWPLLWKLFYTRSDAVGA